MTWLDSTGSQVHDYWVTGETFYGVRLDLNGDRATFETTAEPVALASPEEKQAAIKAISAWEAGLVTDSLES